MEVADVDAFLVPRQTAWVRPSAAGPEPERVGGLDSSRSIGEAQLQVRALRAAVVRIETEAAGDDP